MLIGGEFADKWKMEGEIDNIFDVIKLPDFEF